MKRYSRLSQLEPLMNPPAPDTQMQRQELEEMFVIWQSKLLHPLDSDRWRQVLQSTVKSLLATKPLQSLSKTGRLAVAMCIVGSGETDLLSPTVPVVLACDWIDEWAPSKLLQDTVRQAALARIRCHWGSPDGTPPRDVSREKMAHIIDEGVKDIIDSSWRALGLTGAARVCVEKVGRQLRGLAARCRGSRDRMAALKLLRNYLDSNRIEGFIQALVSWGRANLAVSGQTVFDEAFPFLRARQVQASRMRAELAQVGVGCSGGKNETLELIKSQHTPASKASHQCSRLRSRPNREHEQSLASISDVSPLTPSPFSETRLGEVRDSNDRAENADIMWFMADVQEHDVPSVPPCDTREGGKGTFAKCSVEQKSKKHRVSREGGDEPRMSSTGVADGNGHQPSTRVFADASKRILGTSLARNEESASSHVGGRQGQERGFSDRKYPCDDVMGSEVDEDEVETDEELIGKECGQARGEEVKRETESQRDTETRKGLGKRSGGRDTFPVRSCSATNMERVDLDGEESLHSQPRKRKAKRMEKHTTC